MDHIKIRQRGNLNLLEAPKKSLTRLLQIAVASSPVDPMEGSPNSLFTRMIVDDSNQGITGPFISSKNPIPGQKNNFTISAESSSFNADPYDGESFSIPISYKWNLKSFPKLFFNHTKFWGNELYLETFFDIGISLAIIQKLDYTFVEKINVTFNFSVGVDDSYQNYGVKVSYRF